jgi:hypothetical protein
MQSKNNQDEKIKAFIVFSNKNRSAIEDFHNLSILYGLRREFQIQCKRGIAMNRHKAWLALSSFVDNHPELLIYNYKQLSRKNC